MSIHDILLNLSNELPGTRDIVEHLIVFFSATSIILFKN